jgi:hypothetical protein
MDAVGKPAMIGIPALDELYAEAEQLRKDDEINKVINSEPVSKDTIRVQPPDTLPGQSPYWVHSRATHPIAWNAWVKAENALAIGNYKVGCMYDLQRNEQWNSTCKVSTAHFNKHVVNLPSPSRPMDLNEHTITQLVQE